MSVSLGMELLADKYRQNQQTIIRNIISGRCNLDVMAEQDEIIEQAGFSHSEMLGVSCLRIKFADGSEFHV